MAELHADVLIVGGGVGGCAAAMAATDLGCNVILTEETDWIGGQLTSQAVPSDEHRWIEQFGCTRRYRDFRNRLRQHYRDHYPLNGAAMHNPRLNPGNANVSRIACEPRAALAVLLNMLAWPRTRGRLRVLTNCKPIAADVDGDRVRSVTVHHLGPRGLSPAEITITAPWVLDATELGELLPLTGTEYVSGAESQRDTGEPHAPTGDPQPGNVQAITWCFPMAYDPTPGANHVGDKPEMYDHWASWVPPIQPAWPGRFFDLTDCNPPDLAPVPRRIMPWEGGGNSRWLYRRIVTAEHFDDPHKPHEVTLVNWPQNDYFGINLIDADDNTVQKALYEAKQLSLSWFHWLQTACPRHNEAGEQIGQGYPELVLRPDIVGTGDGLAKYPYIRESRRIKALFTVTENHVGVEARGGRTFNYGDAQKVGNDPKLGAEPFADSVGIGCYRIDLHMSTGGDNYIDVASLPFQIPLGALIPQRTENLLAACKNIGTTHISNGCYRLHPVEWNIGEAAGTVAALCHSRALTPRQIRDDPSLLADLQKVLADQGVELAWPQIYPV